MENVEKRRIFLYGNSVILGTVGASLQRFPEFNVISMAATPDKVKGMNMLERDVVIFDLEAKHPESAFCFLENCPGMLLVGISPSHNLVRIWSGRQARELTTQNLVEFIDSQMKAPLNFSPGGDVNKEK